MKNLNFFKKFRLYKEVFSIMHPDEISSAIKGDAFFVLYGEMLLNRHKKKNIVTLISNKVREVRRRLKLVIQELLDTNFSSLFNLLKSENFQLFIDCTRILCGYDQDTKTFKAPSLVLHTAKNLKMLCDIALKIIIENNRNIPGITWTSDHKDR